MSGGLLLGKIWIVWFWVSVLGWNIRLSILLCEVINLFLGLMMVLVRLGVLFVYVVVISVSVVIYLY